MTTLFFPNINVRELIHPLDVAVFVVVLILTALVVIWGNRQHKKRRGDDSLLEYMLMGRQLTLPLFVMTTVASWYGGIFGVTEIAFQSGVYNFLTQGVFWYATYILFAFFIVPRVRGSGVLTLPEMAGKLFGPKSAKVAAVFNFFNILPISYVLSVGLFLKIIFGGELLWCMILGAGIMTLYSMWGGFRAVVFSDIVQFFVMCSSVALVAILSWTTYGGWDFLKLHLPSTHFDPLGGNSIATTLVWGFIALATLVDPNFYQRCLAAKDARTARTGILISTMIWCAFDLCTTIGGMYARAFLPEAESSSAYMLYALQLLPIGLRGFFLAGVLATILSTLDAFLFIASNTLSYDLGPEKWRRKAWFGHLCSIFVAIVAVVMASFFDGSIKTIWKILGSYAAGCLLVPMLIGYLKPGFLGDRGFVLSTLMGAVVMTIYRLAPVTGFWVNVDGLYVGLAATAVGIGLSKLRDAFLGPDQTVNPQR